MNFIWLVFAHFLGDIAHQSDWQSNNKQKYWYVMFSHCMIWTAFIAMALAYIGRPLQTWELFFLVGGHALADSVKCKFPKDEKHFWMIYPDQLWHLIQLGVVYAF